MRHQQAGAAIAVLAARRRACLLAAVAVLTALPAAACGGKAGSASKTSGTDSAQPTVQQIDAYAQCMRRHGEPGFTLSTQPGPGEPHLFGYTIEGADPAAPQYASATRACAAVLPNAGPPTPTAAQLREQYRADLKVAACMRAHGYPGFPDPTLRNGHLVQLPPPGVDTSSPQFLAAKQACT